VSEASRDALPWAYRVGLQLRELGADDDLIADCLNIDPSAVAMLVYVGVKKLDSLVGKCADVQRGEP
jgi:hypothetical protein